MEGGGEDLLDPLVDLLDDVQEVLARGLEILQLLGQELVPLLQRRELLQRQRVDLAEREIVLLRLPEPAFLLLAVVGHGDVALDGRRDQRVRAVLGNEDVRLDAVVGQGPLL